MKSIQRTLEIAPGVQVGDDKPVFVVAEIGQNHQGSLSLAKQMILAAKRAGADCVKFQKSSLKDKFNSRALQRPYLSPNSWGSTYGEHKEYLEFSADEYRQLQAFAKESDVLFTASAMDLTSAEFLNGLGVPFIKVGSGDVNNLRLHTAVAGYRRPVVVSTGMADLGLVRRVHEAVSRVTDRLALLQCTSSYPCRPADVNLRVIQTYREQFPSTVIGYSGHEEGVFISIEAARLGACIIERHFTLDRNQKGSDHKCSLEPQDLAFLVHHVKNRSSIPSVLSPTPHVKQDLEAALGSGQKQVLECEKSCMMKLGKTIVAGVNICKGTKLTEEMVDIKVAEPRGLDPRFPSRYIGKVLLTDVCVDDSITQEMLSS